MARTLFLLVLLILLLSSPALGQTTVYVPDDYPTIQGTIDAASDGWTILVRPGTYVENLVIDANDITLQSTDGPEVTIIDGSKPVNPAMGSVVVIHRADCTIEGFSVVGGTGYKPGSSRLGGGLYAHYDADGLTVRNNIIRGNTADGGAGFWGARLTGLSIQGCIFQRNVATTGVGGGIRFVYGYDTPRIEDCLFSENSAVSYGGGIFLQYMYFQAEIIRCTFERNQARYGGGLATYTEFGAYVRSCQFVGNAAECGGGYSHTTDFPEGDDNYPWIESSFFYLNSATHYGGALEFLDLYGYPFRLFPQVRSSTIVENTAGMEGGGIYVGSENLVVSNTILSGNSPDQTAGLSGDFRFSLIEGGMPGVENTDESPLFVDPVAGDFRLAPGSVCIDRGNNDEMPDWTSNVDLVGGSRYVDGERDGTAAIDMGCYEYQPHPFDARLGSVNTADGGVNRADVLLVNGSPGDAGRVVTVGLGEPVQLDIAAPPSRPCSRYVVYAWVDEPDPLAVSVQERFGFFLGWTAFPTVFSGGSPQPVKLWNTFGHEPILGDPDFPSDKAPTTLFSLLDGRTMPITATFQGFIEDDAAPNEFGVATTNAVVMRVE